MGQISVKIYALKGSNLSGNQHTTFFELDEAIHDSFRSNFMLVSYEEALASGMRRAWPT
jgi:hypothetical protein